MGSWGTALKTNVFRVMMMLLLEDQSALLPQTQSDVDEFTTLLEDNWGVLPGAKLPHKCLNLDVPAL